MKKMINILLLLTVTIVAGTGCKSEETPTALSASFPYGNTLAWDGTTKNLVITAQGDWQLSVSYPGTNQDWCVPTATSGTGSVSALWVQATRNTSIDDRTAEITVTSGGQSVTATLTQTGRGGMSAQIEGAGTYTTLSYDQTEFKVDVSTTSESTAWTLQMTQGADWCTPSAFSGTGSEVVTFTFGPNSTEGSRTAIFNVTSAAANVNGLTAVQLNVRPELPALIEPQWFREYTNGEFALEYATTKKHPKWVAWVLNTTYKSTVDRTDYWQFDNSLDPYNIQAPSGFYPGMSSSPADYKDQPSAYGTGTESYDRGHMCPSNDRRNTIAMNRATFYYSNMSPQNGPLNQGIWGQLEGKVHNWGQVEGDEIYICCGGTVLKESDIFAYTSPSRMAIPKYYFKAVLRKKADGTYSSIGFWFENRPYKVPEGQSGTQLNYYLDTIIRSVAELETATGLDFFHDLYPAGVPNDVETQKNKNDWTW